RLALRELERTSCLGATIFLTLDDTRVTRQEAATLERAAQVRFEIGQSLCKTVTDRAGLAGKAATGYCAGNVVLSVSIGCDQRLLNEHAQHRTRKEDFHGFGVDQNLAGSRLDPDARHRVLALAGGVGTVLSVDFLFVFRRFRRSRLEGRQSFQRLYGLGHDQALLTFLRFIAATSSFSG